MLRAMNSINHVNLIFFLMFICVTLYGAVAVSADDNEALNFSGFIKDLVDTAKIDKKGFPCVVSGDEIAKNLIHYNWRVIDLEHDSEKYSGCKAIYISKSQEKKLRTELSKLSANKVLTIATFDGFVDMGGMIQIGVGRRNFELTLDTRAVRDIGIRLSPLAMSLVIN